jgi:hypothetical protein
MRIVLASIVLACWWFVVPGVGAEDAPAVELVACPACEGKGSVPCASRCKEGKARCPGACLKKDDPGWKHAQVAGHRDDELWKEFPSHRADKQGGHMWTQAHLGEVIAYQDDVPVNRGKCPTCLGATVVDCKRCGGTGRQQCAQCAGAKSVARADADAYVERKQEEFAASAIRLSDGRELHGKVLSRGKDQVVIRTDDGKMVSVKPEEIASEPKRAAAAP